MLPVVLAILLIICQVDLGAGKTSVQDPLSLAPKDIRLVKKANEEWRKWAIGELWKERKRMDKTPLVKFDHIPSFLLLFKDESNQPNHGGYTESLKHRYSWALVMWAVNMRYVKKDTVVYEASSGNTARSEAYMCSLIGVRYVTVLPNTTERAKVDKIKAAGGEVVEIPPGDTLGYARQLANGDFEPKWPKGFFINQFGNSSGALDTHDSGNSEKESANLFYELMAQLGTGDIPHHTPTHFIFSAATGGTITSVARYVKKYGIDTEIVLADTQYSAYYDLLVSDRFKGGKEDPKPLNVPPGMSGTGFGWAGKIKQGETSSLIPEVMDRSLKIPDLASVAAMHILRDDFGISGGPSTGVNFAAAIKMIGTYGIEPECREEKEEDKDGKTERGIRQRIRHMSKKVINVVTRRSKVPRARTEDHPKHQLENTNQNYQSEVNTNEAVENTNQQWEEENTNQESGEIGNLPMTPPKMVLATLIADKGENYDGSYYNRDWIEENFAMHGGLDVFDCWKRELKKFLLKAKNANHSPEIDGDPIELGAKECAPEKYKKKICAPENRKKAIWKNREFWSAFCSPLVHTPPPVSSPIRKSFKDTTNSFH